MALCTVVVVERHFQSGAFVGAFCLREQVLSVNRARVGSLVVGDGERKRMKKFPCSVRDVCVCWQMCAFLQRWNNQSQGVMSRYRTQTDDGYCCVVLDLGMMLMGFGLCVCWVHDSKRCNAQMHNMRQT